MEMGNELYLAHHGILGQKWGVRRYQNPDGTLTAKGYQRRLNQLDKDMTKNKVNLKKNQNIADNSWNELRSTEASMKVDELNEKIENGKKEIDSLIESVSKDGYILETEDIKRNIKSGGDYAAIAASTFLFGLVGATVSTLATGKNEEGKKYKVKES